ncbi:hypothetical protein [Paracoccus marcusii]|uniref:hypothetical protein n=1 Tax=Paracoccus marcusii TaxID=59779 RepID=UPI0035A6FEF8
MLAYYGLYLDDAGRAMARRASRPTAGLFLLPHQIGALNATRHGGTLRALLRRLTGRLRAA